MPRQKIPDIEFNEFVLLQIPELWDNNKIYINEAYQRSDIWTHTQKVELIKSIINSYSIGVIVLFINENNQFEILDGQQRLLAIKQYIKDELDLSDTDIEKYSSLNLKDKTLLDAYCVYYIQLKSYNPKTKEEDIMQTFLRLQEGTPLNKAEKLNAHRGRFKDLFVEIRETHPIFNYFGKEKRFRWRQLCAELLTLELEGDFDNKIFPSLDIKSMINCIKKYEHQISKKKITFFKGNLDYLYNSLNTTLEAFKPGEVISFYLLISYLRRKRADNKNLMPEFSEFAREFLFNLSRFSLYGKRPKDMPKDLFDRYNTYKLEAKRMTTPDSIKKRFEIMLTEFKRINTYIEKDPQRLHDAEQKRILYFRQKGICSYCNKPLHFKGGSGHHIIPHSEAGKTDDLEHASLLHEKCHQRLEKQKQKQNKKTKKKKG